MVSVPGHSQGQRGMTNYQCLLCAYNTSGKRWMMRQHVSNVHKTNERVSCDICGSSHKNVSALRSHQTKCRRKHGISLSDHNYPLSVLKPVCQQELKVMIVELVTILLPHRSSRKMSLGTAIMIPTRVFKEMVTLSY